MRDERFESFRHIELGLCDEAELRKQYFGVLKSNGDEAVECGDDAFNKVVGEASMSAEPRSMRGNWAIGQTRERNFLLPRDFQTGRGMELVETQVHEKGLSRCQKGCC